MNHCLRLLSTCLTLCLLAACAPKAVSMGNAGFETYYPASIDDKALQIRLALEPAEQAKGLMHHDRLEADHGMLFIFDTAGERSFWMRNTKIPLDLGYLDASGKLIEIHALYPFDETPVRSKSRKILMALEMNQGWFKANGIQQGAQIDLRSIERALRERGVDPKQTALTP